MNADDLMAAIAADARQTPSTGPQAEPLAAASPDPRSEGVALLSELFADLDRGTRLTDKEPHS